jgi:hypothetical protein
MTRRFHTALGVLALVAVALVIGLIIYSDTVSDLLFMLPAWAVVALILAWPVVCLLAVLVVGRAPKLADQMWAEAVERERHPACDLDLKVDDDWDWIELPTNVERLPERPAADVIPIRAGGGFRS